MQGIHRFSGTRLTIQPGFIFKFLQTLEKPIGNKSVLFLSCKLVANQILGCLRSFPYHALVEVWKFYTQSLLAPCTTTSSYFHSWSHLTKLYIPQIKGHLYYWQTFHDTGAYCSHMLNKFKGLWSIQLTDENLIYFQHLLCVAKEIVHIWPNVG